ncbi:MAG: acid-shock protein [Phyllobacteriaceae bacterium]|nr:acid-shock protein [Phyllobacteriaceae bacterium]MBA89296.1 acid-shock protein [Phyllobacteriaceae bacterium]
MGMDRRGDGPGWHRREGGPGMRGDGPRRGMRGDGPGGRMFGRADTDNSGDISLEEFSAAMGGRILGADADGNGELTVGEVADAIIRMRAERRAQRMIERLDMDGDGKLTTAEIENRQKKIFALMDRNDDGKVDRDEIARSRRDHGGWHRGGGWGHHRGWGMMGNSGAGMNDDGDSPAGDGMMEEDGSE